MKRNDWGQWLWDRSLVVGGLALWLRTVARIPGRDRARRRMGKDPRSLHAELKDLITETRNLSFAFRTHGHPCRGQWCAAVAELLDDVMLGASDEPEGEPCQKH